MTENSKPSKLLQNVVLKVSWNPYSEALSSIRTPAYSVFLFRFPSMSVSRPFYFIIFCPSPAPLHSYSSPPTHFLFILSKAHRLGRLNEKPYGNSITFRKRTKKKRTKVFLLLLLLLSFASTHSTTRTDGPLRIHCSLGPPVVECCCCLTSHLWRARARARDGAKQIDTNNTPANTFRARFSPTTLGHGDDVPVDVNYCWRYSFIKLSYLKVQKSILLEKIVPKRGGNAY